MTDFQWCDFYYNLNILFIYIVTKCKERWKNLRGCYTRHLKIKSAPGFDVKFKNSYYLAEYLHFLKPFTKPRKQIGLYNFVLFI